MIFPDIPLDEEQPEHIQFFFEEVHFPFLYPELISKWISSTIEDEHRLLKSIDYIFCKDDYLLDVNVQYLNHDTLTDIITFQYHEEGRPVEGEIYISIDRIAENAIKFKTTFDHELHRVIIHGALHLAGYKDKSKADKAIMTEKEDHYLAQLAIQMSL
jgi:probable rRNA maturation factor